MLHAFGGNTLTLESREGMYSEVGSIVLKSWLLANFLVYKPPVILEYASRRLTLAKTAARVLQ